MISSIKNNLICQNIFFLIIGIIIGYFINLNQSALYSISSGFITAFFAIVVILFNSEYYKEQPKINKLALLEMAIKPRQTAILFAIIFTAPLLIKEGEDIALRICCANIVGFTACMIAYVKLADTFNGLYKTIQGIFLGDQDFIDKKRYDFLKTGKLTPEEIDKYFYESYHLIINGIQPRGSRDKNYKYGQLSDDLTHVHKNIYVYFDLLCYWILNKKNIKDLYLNKKDYCSYSLFEILKIFFNYYDGLCKFNYQVLYNLINSKHDDIANKKMIITLIARCFFDLFMLNIFVVQPAILKIRAHILCMDNNFIEKEYAKIWYSEFIKPTIKFLIESIDTWKNRDNELSKTYYGTIIFNNFEAVFYCYNMKIAQSGGKNTQLVLFHFILHSYKPDEDEINDGIIKNLNFLATFYYNHLIRTFIRGIGYSEQLEQEKYINNNEEHYAQYQVIDDSLIQIMQHDYEKLPSAKCLDNFINSVNEKFIEYRNNEKCSLYYERLYILKVTKAIAIGIKHKLYPSSQHETNPTIANN